MVVFLETVLRSLKRRFDSDAVDRLNYKYTTTALVCATLAFVAKAYIGKNVQCWVPKQFAPAWEQYAEMHCFVENTYLVNDSLVVPPVEQRHDSQITYYQWVPFVTWLQALSLLVPFIVWRLLVWPADINLKNMLVMCHDKSGQYSTEGRQKIAATVSGHMADCLSLQAKRRSRFAIISNNYTSMCYIVTKVLYVLVALCWLLTTGALLGFGGELLWPRRIWRQLTDSAAWKQSSFFPRVTMCDFQIRQLGNVHNWTVQCVLMTNMIHEKFYILLGHWFLLLFVLNIVTLCYWIVAAFNKAYRVRFVRQYLAKANKGVVEHFAVDSLNADCALLLRFVSINVGELMTKQIVQQLFDKYKARQLPRRTVAPPNADENARNGAVETPLGHD